MHEDKKVKQKIKPEYKEAKPKKRRVRRFLISFVNVKRWVAADQVATGGKMVIHGFKHLFGRKEPKHHETFEEAMRRLRLTEEALQKRTKHFLFMASFYSVVALLALTYSFHLYALGHTLAMICGFILTLLISAHAFREHFWYMQMKKHRLGCNFHDWLKFCTDAIKFNSSGAKK